MREKFFLVLFGILLLGTGCKDVTGPSSSTSSEFSDTIPTTTLNPGSRFVDHKYLAKALKEGENIREVTVFSRSYGMPDRSIDKQQIKKYFQLKNADFALFQSGGIKENRELVPQALERSGILYAYDDKQWHIFFEVYNKEETDRNNPYYIWNEGEKINILVHDIVGANNGEGTAKIVSSVDAGRSWKIERCFYLNWDIFNTLQKQSKSDFPSTLTQYLTSKLETTQMNEEYRFNPQTGNFESEQLVDQDTGRMGIVSIDACKNINLPPNK